MEQEGDTVLIFGECFGKEKKCAKAHDKLIRSVASLERQHKAFFIASENIFTKLGYSSSEKYGNSCDI
jgi:hypothetical protein